MADATDFKDEDDPLVKEGWERRSILDEPRLSEVVQMYRDMGLQVKVVELDPKLLIACDTCLTGAKENYKVVYTKGTVTQNDELF